MHIVDRRLNPGGKKPRQPPALHAPRQSADPQGGARKRRPAAASRTRTRAARSSLPAQGVHEPVFRRGRAGGVRDHVLPGNKEYVRGRHDPAAARRRRRRRSGRQPGRRGRGRFRLRPVARRVPRPLPRRPGTARPRQAPGGRMPKALSWDRAGYSVDRLAGEPRAAAHRAQRLSRRIALRRPKPERDRRRCASEIAALRDDGRIDERRMALRGRAAAQAAPRRALIPYIDPLDVRYKRFERASEAGGPGGDVLPDGRLRLDDRAHEGPGQALLHAALPVPDAPLRARRRGVHPPHPPGAGGGRGHVLPLPRDRRHRGVHRAGGDARSGRRERYSPDAWNIYAAQASDGDNTASDNERTARAADRRDPAGRASTSPIWRSAANAEHFPPGFIRRDSDLWQTYAEIVRSGAPMAMRKVSHRRDIYPVFRELFARKQAARRSRSRMTARDPAPARCSKAPTGNSPPSSAPTRRSSRSRSASSASMSIPTRSR